MGKPSSELIGIQVERAAEVLTKAVELLRNLSTEAQVRVIVSATLFLNIRDEVAERLRGVRG